MADYNRSIGVDPEKCASVGELEDLRMSLEAGLTLCWTLLSVFNIFSMQLGFAMLEVGTIHRKHTKSILMKNLFDCAVGMVGWYFFGYGIYSGTGFVTNNPEYFLDLLKSYAFSATTSTILSGSVSARMRLTIYLLFSLILSCVLYPLVASWVWQPGGWLYGTYKDFAGGVVVHGFGGAVGFAGAVMCGPRAGRFDSEAEEGAAKVVAEGESNNISDTKRSRLAHMLASNPSMQILGTFILWTSWFSFNGVSAGGLSEQKRLATLRACMNTILASAVSGTIGLVLSRRKLGYFDLSTSINAFLSGLVAITSSCGEVDTWAACVIGTFAVAVFIPLDNLFLSQFHVDDPLSASALHGGCGALGGILTGVFHRELGLITGKTELFAMQVYGTLAIMCFGLMSTFSVLWGIRRLTPLICSEEDQVLGLDFKYHDGKHFEELTALQMSDFQKQKLALERAKVRRSLVASQRISNSVLST